MTLRPGQVQTERPWDFASEWVVGGGAPVVLASLSITCHSCKAGHMLSAQTAAGPKACAEEHGEHRGEAALCSVCFHAFDTPQPLSLWESRRPSC